MRPTGGAVAIFPAIPLACVIRPSDESTRMAAAACSRIDRAKRSAMAISSALRCTDRSVIVTSRTERPPMAIELDQTATGMAPAAPSNIPSPVPPSATRGAGSANRLSNRLSTRSADERSEEHTSELQSLRHLVCRLLLEKKKINKIKEQKTDIR